MHSYLLTWHNFRLKHLKGRSHKKRNRRSGGISSNMVAIFRNTDEDVAIEKIVPVPLNIMGYHIGNVCYVFLISDQVLSYAGIRKINTQQTRVQQYNFLFTLMSHILLCLVNIHTTNN